MRASCVCGAAMATPLRMQMHLQGKRHCEAVARRYLRGVSRNAMPDASSAAEAPKQHSQARGVPGGVFVESFVEAELRAARYAFLPVRLPQLEGRELNPALTLTLIPTLISTLTVTPTLTLMKPGMPSAAGGPRAGSIRVPP